MIPRGCNFGRVSFFIEVIRCLETESTYAGNVTNTRTGVGFLREVEEDLFPDVLQKVDELLYVGCSMSENVRRLFPFDGGWWL